jgi:cysteine desulfurase
LQIVKPDGAGRIFPEQWLEAARPDTALITLAHGNNEIGTINDLARSAGLLKARFPGARLLADVSQTASYGLPPLQELPLDLVIFGAHKMYGPRGIGALFVRRGTRLRPIFFGGSQQAGLRPGTLDAAMVAGFGEAAALAKAEGSNRATYINGLRNAFWSDLQAGIPGVRLNGDSVHRVPGNLSVILPFVEAEIVRQKVPHIACSQGSACSSNSREVSAVLSAIGLTEAEALRTVRFGISIFNTLEEIHTAARDLAEAILRYAPRTGTPT